jgi:hypothetical protein
MYKQYTLHCTLFLASGPALSGAGDRPDVRPGCRAGRLWPIVPNATILKALRPSVF